VASTTVVVRQITNGPEAAAILDALDATVELPSDRLSTGRRYTLEARTQTDRATAVATLRAALDGIDPTWATHVKIANVA
jgi:hypothetical protein